MATNDPLQGGPTPPPNPVADPVNQLAPKAPGQPSHDDHDTSGPPAPEVIARGYEEDVYDTKTVLSVPVLVVLFFVLAFGTTSVLFYVVAPSRPNPNAHPQAKERNQPDLNTRLGRIYRGSPEVDQPRLEPLRIREPLPGLPEASSAITRPEKPGVNSPELHPEDLVPTPKNYPALFAGGGDRVGLDKAFSLGDEALKGLFKSSAPPLAVNDVYSSYSGNDAGRLVDRTRAPQPEPKFGEAKKDEPKKEPTPKAGDPKKDEPKADPKLDPKKLEPKKEATPK